MKLVAPMKLIFIFIFLHNVCAVTNFINQEYETNMRLHLGEGDVSQSCSKQLEIYDKGLHDKKEWALKLFASTSRIPTGIFSSGDTDLGDFDQCLGVAEQMENQTISGKYCLAKFTHRNDLFLVSEKNMSLYNVLEICLPSACSDEEVSKIWFENAREYYVTEIACQVKTNASPDLEFTATVTFLVILLFIIAFSTTYDIFNKKGRKELRHKALTAFSIVNNGKLLFCSSEHAGKIGCLDGIRTLALAWIMLGHRWDSYYTLPLRNLKHFINRYYYPSTMLVARAYVLNVNSFLVMGGALVTYSFLRAKDRCNKFRIVPYYVNRYMRLTPSLAAMVLIQITTFKFLGSGPMWPITTGYMEDDCRGYWWSALLYTQNYVNPLYMCIIPAWYLSVDMQLYLLSPLILIPLCEFPKKTLVFLVILITGVTILTAGLYWNKELTHVFHIFQKASVFSSEQLSKYYTSVYIPTHSRCNSWFIGVILGYILYQGKEKTVSNLSKRMVLFLWTMSFLFLAVCLLPSHNFLSMPYNRAISSIWGPLINPIWSLAVSWIIFACVNDYGGPINRLLSLSIFKMSSKLSYSIYIVHFAVIQFRIGLTRYPILFSTTKLIEGFLGDYVFTIIVAIIWYTAFEAPFGGIQELFIKGYRCGICEKCNKSVADSKKNT